MILQYGNLTLLSVEELDGGMFPKVQDSDGEKIYGEGKWRLHDSGIKIFGINIEVPDIYPILKYPEARRSKSRRSTGYVKVNNREAMNDAPAVPPILEPKASLDVVDGSYDHSSSGYLPRVEERGANRVLKLSELDDMIERLRQKRSHLHQPVGLHAGPTLTSIEESVNGEMVDSTGQLDDDVVTDGVLKPGLKRAAGSIRKARSRDG